MRHFSLCRLVLILGLLTTVVGCSRDPNVRKQKYLKSGQQYFEKGKYNEAVIEFSNAIQVDPRFAEAHYQLAQTFVKLQQWQRAYHELGRTLELQPKNYQAHFDIANLLIAGRDLKQAKEHLDWLLDKQPNNPQTHVAVANLLAAQENLSGAIQEMQQAITLGPDRWDSHLSLALLQLKTDALDAAEANFKKAVELNPKALSAQLALGNYYQMRSRFSEAEQQFRRAMEIEPQSPDPRAALARIYMLQGKQAEAEALLQQTKRDLADNSAGYRMLGDLYFATDNLDKATAEYDSLYREHPKDLLVKKNYIQLLILKGRLAEARKLTDEILSNSVNDTEALIFRGQIQTRDGQVNEAVQTLQTAIQNDPENGLAHYHLGLAFDQQGNLARAESEWRDAVRLRPDLAEAYRALAAVAVRRADMSALEQAASQIIALQPASSDGYALRALSFINRKQFARAEEDSRRAIEVKAQSAMGYVQMGNLQAAQKRYSEAERWYQLGLDHEPASADALSGLMNTCFAQQQVDKAIAAAKSQIAKVPNSSAFYDLLGTALHDHKQDLDGAEAALRKAAELDTHNADALLKLGQVLVAKGSVDQAIAVAERALRDNPREISFYILMGQLYEPRKEWNKAKEVYQKALEIKPDHPLASNNLAYVMLETGGNVDVALSLAQTARRGMPDSPNAADTLGWVYYQKGAYKSAIDLFKEALRLAEKSKAPESAAVHYHLGLAYERTGQPVLARQHLERVLKINPNYSDAGEVKKVLAQLR